jgi:hypothetical protein
VDQIINGICQTGINIQGFDFFGGGGFGAANNFP